MSAPDAGENDRRVHVVLGEHAVSDDPSVVLTTVLGSCVAACVRDPATGVGGMNHFILPEGDGEGAHRFGAYAMELLLNDILRRGGRRERLEAKLFGGARMFEGLFDAGAANAAFARKFLADEGVTIVSESLGGNLARRVQYWPATGRARQRTVADPLPVVSVEQAARRTRPDEDGAVELF